MRLKLNLDLKLGIIGNEIEIIIWNLNWNWKIIINNFIFDYFVLKLNINFKKRITTVLVLFNSVYIYYLFFYHQVLYIYYLFIFYIFLFWIYLYVFYCLFVYLLFFITYFFNGLEGNGEKEWMIYFIYIYMGGG